MLPELSSTLLDPITITSPACYVTSTKIYSIAFQEHWTTLYFNGSFIQKILYRLESTNLNNTFSNWAPASVCKEEKVYFETF